MTVSSTLGGVFLKGTAAARPAANAVAGGTVYSATDTGVISQSDGSSWSTWATIASGMTDPMTTRGDIIIRNAANATARLGIGAAGTSPVSDGVDIAYGNPNAKKHACRASDTSGQSILNNTQTAVLLGAADLEDTDNFHFTSAANLTGTVAKTASSAAIVGTGTSFTTELTVGQMISVPGTAAEVRVVTVITDNTHLTVNSNFANTASGQTATRVNTGLVAQIAGDYDIGGTVVLASNSATGFRFLGVRVNGSNYVAIDERAGYASAASEQYISIATHYPLALWDYVELVYRHTQGTTLTLSTNAAYGCHAWMKLTGV
jgi:hypothetical protein